MTARFGAAPSPVVNPPAGYPFHPLRRSAADALGQSGPGSAEPAGEFFAPLPSPPPPDELSPAYPSVEPDRRGGRRLLVVMVAVAVVVVLVVLAGAALLVVNVLQDRTAPNPAAPLTTTAPTPAETFEPPGDLRLRDDGTSVTLTWTDPSGGVVPFVVAGGQAGRQLGAMTSLDPGRTSWTVNGLNPRLDYCFTVLAVYSTESYATSGQVCTTRKPAPTPS
ncbi:fibronectin type III domain-containing protein [Micromonospora pallida]|uniref:fibronectin type III domain-containing protein n=1 Tax=Micromonospora pallida TaxID=145854 RepID=UPI001FE0C7B2|nr:fibronectin type III domain-containing protein [Micromonospora pallida]